jgi:hypothetical protein
MQNSIHRGGEPDDEAGRANRFPIGFAEYRPTAERDYRASAAGKLSDDPGLHVAECRFAVLAEDGGNRFTRPTLNFIIRINPFKTQPSGQLARHRSLSRAAVADKEDWDFGRGRHDLIQSIPAVEVASPSRD